MIKLTPPVVINDLQQLRSHDASRAGNQETRRRSFELHRVLTSEQWTIPHAKAAITMWQSGPASGRVW